MLFNYSFIHWLLSFPKKLWQKEAHPCNKKLPPVLWVPHGSSRCLGRYVPPLKPSKRSGPLAAPSACSCPRYQEYRPQAVPWSLQSPQGAHGGPGEAVACHARPHFPCCGSPGGPVLPCRAHGFPWKTQHRPRSLCGDRGRTLPGGCWARCGGSLTCAIPGPWRGGAVVTPSTSAGSVLPHAAVPQRPGARSSCPKGRSRSRRTERGRPQTRNALRRAMERICHHVILPLVHHEGNTDSFLPPFSISFSSSFLTISPQTIAQLWYRSVQKGRRHHLSPTAREHGLGRYDRWRGKHELTLTSETCTLQSEKANSKQSRNKGNED